MFSYDSSELSNPSQRAAVLSPPPAPPVIDDVKPELEPEQETRDETPPISDAKNETKRYGAVTYDPERDPIDFGFEWRKCPGPVAVDYIPCLDNFKAIKALRSRKQMEHQKCR
uniref:Uncharacterized protein n=1 Tax=Kalanchoe fedtschenkoi TaxID=63787 RepID=A0A7N1A9H6_KALFE